MSDRPPGEDFWDFFRNYAAPKLDYRASSFQKVFEYLDGFEAPITIVETGCVRLVANWGGDGQSTILFDHYVRWRGGGSKVYSVDLSPEAVELCKTLVSDAVELTVQDSVPFLDTLSVSLLKAGTQVQLFYLDSFDIDWLYWMPSAVHHLKELLSAWRCITPATLVVVDDCPGIDETGGHGIYPRPQIGGKGRLIAEFAQQTGAQLLFLKYQAGWIGFKGGSNSAVTVPAWATFSH